jgi:hypothetical protein
MSIVFWTLGIAAGIWVGLGIILYTRAKKKGLVK